MIATVAARTGISPLDVRDVALDDPVLFDELARAADAWSPELELAASSLEVEHETMRVVLALGGARRVPPPLAVPRKRKLERTPPTRVSVAELAAMTGRAVTRADA